MPYTIFATSVTPALIIYLLDVSGSMADSLGGRRRIDVVADAWWQGVTKMVFRSTKGMSVSPRYRLAMYAYSDHVYDLLGGTKTVDQVVQMGKPPLAPMRSTETAKAFQAAETLLQQELPQIGHCPAPVVCHITDGEYTGADPLPVAQRIMAMAVPDGNVLVENIFISDKILSQPVTDATQWPGITPDTPLANAYAEKLRRMSSPLPESYRKELMEYSISPGALMLLPGESADLVALGIQIAGNTPTVSDR